MSTHTTAVARFHPVLSDVARMTMLGFLAGYRGARLATHVAPGPLKRISAARR